MQRVAPILLVVCIALTGCNGVFGVRPTNQLGFIDQNWYVV
jgi:hypothetical protein